MALHTLKVIILFLISLPVLGQKHKINFKEEIAPSSAMFLAGVFNGVSQDLIFHYDEFENTFPNHNRQFWNPELSWRNKYKNGDPNQGRKFFGSTTFLVGTTDGYHAMLSSRDIMIVTSISLSGKPKSFKHFMKKTIIYTLSYGVGFELSYRRIIK